MPLIPAPVAERPRHARQGVAPHETAPAPTPESIDAQPPPVLPVFLRHAPPPPERQRLQLRDTVSASVPGDAMELEADRIADAVARPPEPSEPFAEAPAKHSTCSTDTCTHGPAFLQRKETATVHGAAPPPAVPHATPAEAGVPLDSATRAIVEPRFGCDFGDVRIHTGGDAAQLAETLGARAYTTGRDIVFGGGEFAPGTEGGRHLLAHELAHVVQQRRGAGRGTIMRTPLAMPTTRARPATVAEAAEFLEDMARFIDGALSFASTLMRTLPRQQPPAATRQRAYNVINQQRLREFVANAWTVYSVQEAANQSGSTDGTRLRTALLGVLDKVRRAAPYALQISNVMPSPTPDTERGLHAKLLAEMIEADPFTSASLLGTPSFGAAETTAGASHERFIEASLDDLIRSIPGRTLPAAERDAILSRINAGLRRAFVTIGTGTSGTVDVREITNTRIASKYRQVTELLLAAMSSRPAQASLLTESPPSYTLPPDPVPDVSAQLQASAAIGTVDFSHVPASELPYVRHGVLQAANTTFPAVSTSQFRNAVWPVVFHVRRAGTVVDVRYELIFDANRNVRVERLGDARAREVSAAFSSLSVADKKAQLIADFGLAGVDDRPRSGTRSEANWTGPELDQIKAMYDRLPQADRSALRGVTIVRDHVGPPPTVAGGVTTGYAHISNEPAHDRPGPPAHSAPHIHYYDAAFSANQSTAVGAPGGTGPGGDWTVAHEVGHMRIFLATRNANAAIAAANAQFTAANARLVAIRIRPTPQQRQLLQAYGQAAQAANTAVTAVNRGIVPPAAKRPRQPVSAAERAQLIQAATTANAARDQARADMATGGIPATLVQAAQARDTASDARLAASVSLGAAQDQIPTFVSLARTFGFTAFTDYARRGGDGEFFAETYALYIGDPNRLSLMNRSIFLWFEAGMPMNAAWRP